jgi:hypothetical protein
MTTNQTKATPTKNLALEASIKAFAKQFDIPVKLAREAFTAAEGNYMKAYEYVLALAKQGKL